MRKCIILFLITGIVWAQTGFDKLILKGGQKYLGKISNIDNQTVYFKPESAFTSQPINVKYIHTLQLKHLKQTPIQTKNPTNVGFLYTLGKIISHYFQMNPFLLLPI